MVTIVYQTERRMGRLAWARLATETITINLRDVIKYATRQAKWLGNDVVDTVVEQLSETIFHELIHIMGGLTHDSGRLSQPRFNAVGLMCGFTSRFTYVNWWGQRKAWERHRKKIVVVDLDEEPEQEPEHEDLNTWWANRTAGA